LPSAEHWAKVKPALELMAAGSITAINDVGRLIFSYNNTLASLNGLHVALLMDNVRSLCSPSFFFVFSIDSRLRENLFASNLFSIGMGAHVRVCLFRARNLQDEEGARFFTETLPEIARYALQLTTSFPTPESAPAMIRQGEVEKVTLSQNDAAVLLASMMLMTLPEEPEVGA
jgi:hypothetical protein